MDVELGGGLRLTVLSPWVHKQKLLERFSRVDREAVRQANHAFVVTYDAGALGEADPNSNGADRRSIQETKYELCVVGNLALWLSRPSPAGPGVLVQNVSTDGEAALGVRISIEFYKECADAVFKALVE